MKKHNRSKWVSGVLLVITPLLLVVLGAWTYSKELVVQVTNTEFLAKPHSLPVDAVNRFQDKLTAVEVTMRVDHQAIKPSWWGETENLSFVSRDLVYSDANHKQWGIFYNRTRFSFDEARQQYVVIFEGLVPYGGQGTMGRIASNFKVERRGNAIGSFPLDLPVSRDLAVEADDL